MSDLRVLIVEDEPAIAKFIESSLTTIGYEVAALAFDFEEAMEVLTKEEVDIALLDINLEAKQDGIDLANYINEHHRIPFIFLTSHSSSSVVDRAKQTRPMGYILKPFTESSLYAALEIAMYNHAQSFKTRDMSINAINRVSPTPFSSREYEILMDIYDGKTNQQIAELRFVSVNTVKTHVRNIFSKLDVGNRWEMLVCLRELMT